MFEQRTVEEAIIILNDISGEATPALRGALLGKYLGNQTGEVLKLIELVLSFQVSGILKVHAPVFNTLSYAPLDICLQDYFNGGNTLELPYIIQSILYYMSSPLAIGLRVKILVSQTFSLTNVHTWLAEYTDIEVDDTGKCKLCNDEDSSNICYDCYKHLEEFTDYRSADFILNVSPQTCKWLVPIQTIKPFTKELEYFIAEQLDESRVLFSVKPGVKYLAKLPIQEFMKETA